MFSKFCSLIALLLLGTLRAQCPVCQEPDANSACIPCGSGWYKPEAAQAACMPCPFGPACPDCRKSQPQQQPARGSGGGALVEASARYSQSCSPGQYIGWWLGSCTACPARRYCPGDGNSYYCPPGTYATGGAAACTRCAAGFFTQNYGWRRCDPCPAGQTCAPPPSRLPAADEALLLFGAQQLNFIYKDTAQLALQSAQEHANSALHTLGVAGYNPALKKIVALFRGTVFSQLQNLLIDIDIVKVAYPPCAGCQVHRGFYNAYKSLQSLFIQDI